MIPTIHGNLSSLTSKDSDHDSNGSFKPAFINQEDLDPETDGP